MAIATPVPTTTPVTPPGTPAGYVAPPTAPAVPQGGPTEPDTTNPLSQIVSSGSSAVTTSQGFNPLSIVDSVGSQPAPTPPSMTAILNESNIPNMQTNVATLQQQYTALQTQFNNYSLSLNGNGVPQGIVDVETDATAKGMQVQLDNLQAAMQSAQTNLTNAQQWVGLQMQAQGTDYSNAVTAYNTAFSNALSVQQVLNGQANINQQNAAAYLSTLSGLITSGSLDPTTLPAATKASIATAELQAGWPVGTIENFTSAKPGANIVGSVNSVDGSGNQVTTLIHQNTDGSYGMTNITMPGSPVSLFGVLPSGGSSGSTSSSPNGYTGSILSGTSLDPTTPLSQVLQNPQQLSELFGAMNTAEGGGAQVGSQYNNPLDMEYNNTTAALGATNSGATTSSGIPLAAFPDQVTAEGAYSKILGSPQYANMTLDQALQQWSGYNGSTSSGSSGGSSSVIQSWVQNIQNGNANLTNVPAGLKNSVSQALASTAQTSYSPLASSRFTTAANRIVSNYISLPAYQLVSGGQVYLQRIAAAQQNPGSISDQDLLDSLTQLNKGGGQVSDAQISLVTNGQSFSDWADTLLNKLGNGGVLSDNQRQQISTIANNVYSNYLNLYQPIYQQATSQLSAAGIPQAFWTIPNLDALGASAGVGSSSGTQSIQQQASSAGYDYSAMSAVGYSDAEIQAAIAASSTPQ